MKRFITFLATATLATICLTPAYANEAPKQIELSMQTVNAVLQYLGSKPYIETAQLIHAIQQEADAYTKAQAAKAEADKAKKKDK